MNEIAVVSRLDEPPDGREPGIYCACLAVLVAGDIERGYHAACGRSVELVLGPPPVG